MLNQILLGDCYELMKSIPDCSIDLVLTDPPYNTTSAEWDKQPIDLIDLWQHFKRILKPGGSVVATASQPFTTTLIMSNPKWFKYCLVWDKKFAGNFVTFDVMPMKTHEDIVVFNNGNSTYNPQKIKRTEYIKSGGMKKSGTLDNGDFKPLHKTYDEKNPISILSYPRLLGRTEHETQKPVELFQYLALTYSNPGETILDPFCGSGTTALAAYNTGRNFIAFEKKQEHWNTANKRLALAQMQGRFEEMVG